MSLFFFGTNGLPLNSGVDLSISFSPQPSNLSSGIGILNGLKGIGPDLAWCTLILKPKNGPINIQEIGSAVLLKMISRFR